MSRGKAELHDIIPEIHNHSIDIKNRVIYLHSYINDPTESLDEPGIDFKVSTQFIKNLHVLELLSSDPIIIYLSSGGGCVNFSLSIYDAIKNCPLKIAIVGHGIVASSASFIFQAADLRILYPFTQILLHDMSVWFNGKRLDVLNHATQLKKEFNLIIDIYVEMMMSGEKFKGKSALQIKSFLLKKLKNSPELYLTAQEAVEWGLADGIFGTKNYISIQSIKNGV